MTGNFDARAHSWPSLPLESWQPTYSTLHLWTQIVGKIRLVQMPWINHSWHVTLYVTATRTDDVADPAWRPHFPDRLRLSSARAGRRGATTGAAPRLALEPQSVATFYAPPHGHAGVARASGAHHRGCPTRSPIPSPSTRTRPTAPTIREYAIRFWRILVQADRVFKEFRARFIGKCSPVHFFWGAPDLAVTRFSGRTAPPHPGGVPHLPDWVTREAYSHEVSSCGFWPGGGPIPYAAFYSYAYPEPPGFAEASVQPPRRFYSSDLREFILPYDAVRKSRSPDETLLEFLQSTYESAARLAAWDRAALERERDPRSAR